ncbi:MULTISPECIES: hypothetical protein [unclassified Halomonas]|uniref:hypothetical protein n=1 Tax=unclassified Halomonas TaxID=2609666 RepID=UPI0009906BD2|nr:MULTISPECIES: hypothetical protein [unclassified Halomonas]AQU83251.1 hypothetical protein B2G49_12150 [Halomonas sp. 'Soap Lake \
MSDNVYTVNVNRTYQYPVNLTVYDENGKENTGKFYAKFKILPTDKGRELPEDTLLLDKVLVGVSKIALTDDDGKVLEGDELLHAAKNDPAISVALVSAYQESVTKKNRGRI